MEVGQAETMSEMTFLDWILLPVALVGFFIFLVVLFFVVGAIIHGPMGMLKRTTRVFAKEAAKVGSVMAVCMALSNTKPKAEETNENIAEGEQTNTSTATEESKTEAWQPSKANPDDPYWKRLYEGNQEFIDEFKKMWSDSEKGTSNTGDDRSEYIEQTGEEHKSGTSSTAKSKLIRFYENNPELVEAGKKFWRQTWRQTKR